MVYVIGEDLAKAYDEKAKYNHYKAKGIKGLTIEQFSQVKAKTIKFIIEKTYNNMENMSIKSYSWLDTILSHSGLKLDATEIQLVSSTLCENISGPCALWSYSKGTWKKVVKRGKRKEKSSSL